MLWRSTNWYEKTGSPVEGFKLDESGVHRIGYMPENPALGGLGTRRQAAIDFCGFSAMYTDNNGPGATARYWIERQIPHPYPAPDVPPAGSGGISPPSYAQTLFCTAVEQTKPLGITRAEVVNNVLTGEADKVGNADRFTEVALHYQCFRFFVKTDANVLAGAPTGATGTDNPLYNVTAGLRKPDEGYALSTGWLTGSRYVMRNIKPGGRVVKFPGGVFKYISDREPCAESLTINEPMLDIQYTWMWVPVAAYPQQAILAGLGCCSGLAFDGWPAGTLMFLNSSTEEHTDALGQIVLNVTHHFRFVNRFRRNGAGAGTPLGWNAAPRFAAGGVYDYEVVTSDGTADPKKLPFLQYDMTRIFRPDQAYLEKFMI